LIGIMLVLQGNIRDLLKRNATGGGAGNTRRTGTGMAS